MKRFIPLWGIPFIGTEGEDPSGVDILAIIWQFTFIGIVGLIIKLLQIAPI